MPTSTSSTNPEGQSPLDVESLRRHIPYYLTAEDQRILVDEIRTIASGGNVQFLLDPSSSAYVADMLQGDGWRGFQIYLIETEEKRSIRGLVLSNSCDIDPGNPRDVPSRVIFAPLVRLSVYKRILEASGVASHRIEKKLSSIREQRTTNLFYIPPGGSLTEEYVVRFDEAQSMLVSRHGDAPDREKLFMLSNTGFYMLILKLSIHFCRLQEKIDRRSLLPR